MKDLATTLVVNPYRFWMGLGSIGLGWAFATRTYAPKSVQELPLTVYLVMSGLLFVGGLFILAGIWRFERQLQVEPLQAGLLIASGAYISYGVCILAVNAQGFGVAFMSVAFGMAFLLDSMQVSKIVGFRRTLLEEDE